MRNLQVKYSAVVAACVLMLIYIWIRFNAMSGLLAGFASVVALVHDVMVDYGLCIVQDSGK